MPVKAEQSNDYFFSDTDKINKQKLKCGDESIARSIPGISVHVVEEEE